MAPPSSSLTWLGSSGSRVAARANVVLGGGVVYDKRQSQMDWSAADQADLAKIVDGTGGFNGTCTTERNGLPPQVNGGECASYYPNVTTYCCAAVGGSIVQLSQQGGDSNGDGATDANSTTVEPACQTSNYQDMLLCYMYTAEEHCRSAVSGPWGICNTATGDSSSETNTTSSQNSTSTPTSSPATNPAGQSSSSSSSGSANAARPGRQSPSLAYKVAFLAALCSSLLLHFLVDEAYVHAAR